jgi:branched-chain amino acid aminotransferase
MKIYLNDRIVPEEEALVPVTDRGFLYGDGVFETMRAYSGVIFMLKRHMERLARSADLIGLGLPRDEDGIISAVMETIGANSLRDAITRVSVTRGAGPRGIDPTVETRPTFVVMAWPFSPYPSEFFERGVELITARTRRNISSSLDPAIKSMNFLNNIMAKGEASRAGAFDALMLNAEGYVAECTVSNIFFVRDGAVHTPSLASGILAGVTRQHVLSLARGLGHGVEEGMYMPEELQSANEVFLTGTSIEVLPVSRLDKAGFPVGPVTRGLMAAYKESTP